MDRKHMNIRVLGRVQGVSYRVSARHQANALGLVGFVRNEPDGSVYIEVEGTTDNIGIFLEWCRVGPPPAVVTSCETEESHIKHFPDFSIQR